MGVYPCFIRQMVLEDMCRKREFVKVKVTAMGEERKAPTTMEKNGYDFIKCSLIHD